MNFKLLLRGLVILLACIALSVLLWVFSKLLGIYWIYGLFFGKVISIFGLDIVFSRMIAALLTILTLLSLPWFVSFLFLGRRKALVLIVGVVLIIGGAFTVYYGSADIFFDRETGKSVKYYVKTLDGFKFSNSEDYDPRFGIKYKPITPEVVKEFYSWEKTGKMQNIPKVTQGKYFDQITGEPIVWYAERSQTEIELFSLPGHDPLTGQVLKVITAEIIKQKIPKVPEITEKWPDGFTLDDYLAQVCLHDHAQSASKLFLDWYLSFKGGDVNSEAMEGQATNSYFFSSGDKVDSATLVNYNGKPYFMAVEKIIFKIPYTIIGSTYSAIEKTGIDTDGSIIDNRGIVYIPKTVLTSGSTFSLVAGERKRVIYIIEYVDPKYLDRGSFSHSNKIVVPFAKK